MGGFILCFYAEHGRNNDSILKNNFVVIPESEVAVHEEIVCSHCSLPVQYINL